MKRQILAVTVGIALTAAVLTPALSSNNQAFAQVTAESRVLQAILGLTDQIKEQTTEIKGKYDDTIFDLNLKKKFYEFTHGPSAIPPITSIGVFVVDCPNGDSGACAFNVESVQFSASSSAIVNATIVDGVRTDVFDKGIGTPTNFMIDSGIGKAGASESFEVELEGTYTGGFHIDGEKPQGMNLCFFVVIDGGQFLGLSDACFLGDN